MKFKILLVSNDAGATEYIAHLVLQEYTNFDWKIFAIKNSPASKIFKNLDLNYTVLNSIQELNSIEKCDLIMYGTGWQVDFQKIVEEIAQRYSIKSIAILDHWINYRERFKFHTPKNIIVMDDVAYGLAKKTFDSKTLVVQLKFYYLEYIKSLYKSIDFEGHHSVTFISEPTTVIAKYNHGDENAYGFTEYSVLHQLLLFFDEITIRLHPADDRDKYNDIINKYPRTKVTVIHPYEEELVETLSRSILTIGFDGMALFISYFLGIKTVSYMPNSSRKLTIPMPRKYLITELEELKDIYFDNYEKLELDKNAVAFDVAIETFLKG